MLIPNAKIADDEELARLDREIREAGERLSSAGESAPPFLLDFSLAGCLGGLLLHLCLMLPAKRLYVGILERQFRRRLARLTPEQRPRARRILFEFMSGNARGIVTPLIRQLESPTEVTPAAGDLTSGNEGTPAKASGEAPE